MEYKQLGRAGIEVSRLCLGTMNFGPQTSEADAFRIMDRALEHGINFFDTANVYGWQVGEGITENIIGRWLAQGGGRREKIVLATKVYGKMGEWPNQKGLSALEIRRECEASLKRLQTDYLDLYQMHHIWRNGSWDEIWQAMELLVEQGKVIYVGSSNFAGWHIAQANEAAKRRNFLGLVSEQSLYNLNARTIELEVLPACESYGMGVIPWSPLAAGILAGAVSGQQGVRRYASRIQANIDRSRSRLEQYEAYAKQMGEKPADIAIAWLLANRVVTSVITGPRTIEQLDSSMRALELRLSEDVMKRLDEIFPGPGGAAPEAYAW